MGNRVDEGVVLLVAPKFANQKNCIENESGDDDTEKNDAEKYSDAFAPVEDNPTAANGKGQCRQADAERQEKIDGFLAANDAHRRIVAGQGEGVRC
jgi:hypothetical protein